MDPARRPSTRTALQDSVTAGMIYVHHDHTVATGPQGPRGPRNAVTVGLRHCSTLLHFDSLGCEEACGASDCHTGERGRRQRLTNE